MQLSEFELRLCASYMGHSELVGFQTTAERLHQVEPNTIKHNLITQKILSDANKKCTITPLCEFT